MTASHSFSPDPHDPAPRPAIDWLALEHATHVDAAGRGLAGLTAGNGPWDSGQLAATATTLARDGRRVVLVTGFCRQGPAAMTAETDGPPGALILAGTLVKLGIDTVLVSDRYARPLLEAGCDHLGLDRRMVHEMPIESRGAGESLPESDRWCEAFFSGPGQGATHLVAIERPGPSHTAESLVAQDRAGPAPLEQFLRDVPAGQRNRCHNMRGQSIDAHVAKTEQLLAWIARSAAPVVTIGIGDGGNEVGMGGIAWEVLTAALPGQTAGRIVSRVATDHLLLAGVSDWGAYALALAAAVLRGDPAAAEGCSTLDVSQLVRTLVERAGAVDGVTGQPTATVDGLDLDVYLAPLVKMREILGLAR
jgi:hypothetical protein